MSRAGTFAERKRWKTQHPLSQKFTKTDLAKFEHTWDQRPHMVSRGAERILSKSGQLSEKRPPVPDEGYFRHLIARAILFAELKNLCRLRTTADTVQIL